MIVYSINVFGQLVETNSESEDFCTHYVYFNWVGNIHVKEAEFFKSQNGNIEDWGERWIPVQAESIDEAMAVGILLSKQRGTPADRDYCHNEPGYKFLDNIPLKLKETLSTLELDKVEAACKKLDEAEKRLSIEVPRCNNHEAQAEPYYDFGFEIKKWMEKHIPTLKKLTE